MIEVSITAVKGGFRELYRTPNLPQSVAREIRHDSGSGFSLGKEAFAMFTVTNGVVFSKCRIVTDGMGGRRVGNVNISLFIPSTRRLSGENVIELLNKLLDTYCRQYAQDNNLENIIEDWTFVTALTNQYENRLRTVSADDVENSKQGTGEAAFVYYSTNAELQKYFDAPYQEEYNPYRQVFFVEQRFKNAPENPLNALRHDVNPNANLTDRINLENPRYKLKDFYQNGKNGISIEIWANDHRRSNKDFISRKDTIRIRYSKNDRYFIPIDETGEIFDNNIAQYLSVVDENKITVKNDVELHKIEQRIYLEVKDRKGNPISGAEIACKNEFSNVIKQVTGSEIRFEGEELKDRWIVSAKKDNLIARSVTFTPEGHIGSIPLILLEYKIIIFQVIDSEGLVYGYNIQIEDERGNRKDYKDSLMFFEDNFDKSFKIRIIHNQYQTESFDYCPAKDENQKVVKLQKKQLGGFHQGNSNNRKDKRYYLKIDEKFGKRSCDGESIFEYARSYPNFKCDEQFGYKFVKWNNHNRQPVTVGNIDYDGYYEAQFKELWWHKISKKVWIFGGITLAVFIILTVAIILISHDKEEQQGTPLDESKIRIAVQRNKNNNNLDSLNYYKTLWNNQKPEIKETGKTWGIFGKATKDSTEYKQWEVTTKTIGNAISECTLKKQEEQQKQETTPVVPAQPVTHPSNPTPSPANNQSVIPPNSPKASATPPVSTNALEDTFWDLVQKENPTKKEFDDLCGRMKWDGDYKNFYNQYLSKSKNRNLSKKEQEDGWIGFDDGFGKIPALERRVVTKDNGGLTKLKELISTHKK